MTTTPLHHRTLLHTHRWDILAASLAAEALLALLALPALWHAHLLLLWLLWLVIITPSHSLLLGVAWRLHHPRGGAGG